MVVKTKKKRKATKWRGNTTYGHGARKKWKKSGHHGGVGMAGTGKRADHKKSLVIKLFGNNYFGKQGVTSRSSAKKRNKDINVGDIETNLESLMKKYGNGKELILKEYKILGEGEFKEKLTIKAKAFSKSAMEKIEKAGGKAITLGEKESKEEEVEKVTKAKVSTKKK
ncbi:MAG: uL15m family ribosomal protein [Candidatus Pacearchaeota archaeon]|jgi:large subunit ribosomal protein L15